MKRISLFSLLALLVGTSPAIAAPQAIKCTAEYTEANWPYYNFAKYTPDNTYFKFICRNGTPYSINDLYSYGWTLVGLPFKEPNFGGSNVWSIWIEHP